MRTSPSFETTIAHFGLWRAGVALLGLLAAAALAAWAFTTPAPWPVAMAAGLLAAIPCIVAAGILVLRCPPVHLRWDGSSWWWSRGGDPQDRLPIEVTVAVDLGRWMLLRLDRADGARWRRASTWLPAQRRGHEVHWHALRCAVYSPRPVPGGPPAADP